MLLLLIVLLFFLSLLLLLVLPLLLLLFIILVLITIASLIIIHMDVLLPFVSCAFWFLVWLCVCVCGSAPKTRACGGHTQNGVVCTVSYYYYVISVCISIWQTCNTVQMKHLFLCSSQDVDLVVLNNIIIIRLSCGHLCRKEGSYCSIVIFVTFL